MKISAVIPCHSINHNLHQALSSILQQDLAFDEIIVVFNGVEDHAEVIQSIQSQFGSVTFAHIPVASRSKARNMGARIATGNLVAFIDSDVKLTKDWNKNVIDTFSEHNFIDILATCIMPPTNHNILACDFYNKYKSWSSNDTFSSIIKRRKKSHFFAPVVDTAACVYRRDLFQFIGGFDERLERCEDEELSLRCFLSGATIFGSSLIRSSEITHAANQGNLKYLKRFYDVGAASRKLTKMRNERSSSLALTEVRDFYSSSNSIKLTLFFIICRLMFWAGGALEIFQRQTDKMQPLPTKDVYMLTKKDSFTKMRFIFFDNFVSIFEPGLPPYTENSYDWIQKLKN